MTLSRPHALRLAAVALAAFALTAGALLAFHRGAPSAPSPAAGAGLTGFPPPDASTDERIARFQAILRADPGSAEAAAYLAGAYLQKVRETGDPGFYTRADGVLRRALAGDPRNVEALTEAGVLALARHDFRGGLRYGQEVHSIAPQLVKPYGVIVDALVELGRYREAGAALQTMVDAQPNLAAYARVSYFRELHGDLAGAARAMQLAVSAGGDAAENVAYVQMLLGNLEFDRGRLAAAGHAYREALARFPGYVPARAGLGRLDAARGRYDAAIRRYRDAVARLPLPEYVVGLGEAELAAGRPAAARRDLALVSAEERLLRANGVNTDVDLALFEANHGRPAVAVGLARRAWAHAPSVRSADALGWALTRAGDPGRGVAWARRALRLGSRDPLFLYRAGMSALAAGQRGAARSWLARSLADNPRFSPLYAPRARRALEALG
jgi:tetratricopeptide (TPR) repeat protein